MGFREQLVPALLVMYVGGQHRGLQHKPLGIEEQVAFALSHLLATVVAAWATLLGGLRLAFDDRCTGRCLSSSPHPLPFAERAMEPLPESFVLPRSETVVDGGPRWVLTEKRAPRAAAAQQVEYGARMRRVG